MGLWETRHCLVCLLDCKYWPGRPCAGEGPRCSAVIQTHLIIALGSRLHRILYSIKLCIHRTIKLEHVINIFIVRKTIIDEKKKILELYDIISM